jgi:carboxyl-terminal processing protease
MTYVKQNKWKFFATLILAGGLIFAFTFKSITKETPNIRHRKLLSTVGSLLESEHYNPRKIDDQFSGEVFDAYLKALDPEKNLFTQEDIATLSKYKTTLDDEIHGSNIEFEPAVSKIYDIRYKEAKLIVDSILKQPFDYNIEDSVYLDVDSISYPKNNAERFDRWYKLLKYKALEKYASLIEEREAFEKNSTTGKGDSKNDQKSLKDTAKSIIDNKYVIKSDDALEIDARAYVAKFYHKKLEQFEKTFNEEKKFDLFLNAITGLMDPHTDYFAPIEKRSFTEQMSGVIYGIGAQLGADDNGVKIVSVTPGGPAWKSGQLVMNDVITKIAQGDQEPIDIAGYETTDAVKLIRGDLGTEVRLTVKKIDGTVKLISLKREKIVLDEGYARSAVINKGGEKVGYIWLPDFYADFDRPDGARCSQDVATEVEKLKKEKVNSIVIDIRNNGGGSLYEVVQMVGLFINKGPVVQVRDKQGRVQVLNDETPGSIYDGPLVVMVNEFSASASEIFAAAIQDYKRGIIVGSTSTYGKGTVQRNIQFGKPLDSLGIQTEYGTVKLTFQKFYRINGSSTQRKGVMSDIVLPDEYELLKFRERDNPSALSWDQIQSSKYQPWVGSYNIDNIKQTYFEQQKKLVDSNTIKFNNNLQYLSIQMSKPGMLKFDQYQAYKKQMQLLMKENERMINLKDPMQVVPIKADYDKFYNNPDKPKQERYQAWLKYVAKDRQIAESCKLLGYFNPAKLAAN